MKKLLALMLIGVILLGCFSVVQSEEAQEYIFDHNEGDGPLCSYSDTLTESGLPGYDGKAGGRFGGELGCYARWDLHGIEKGQYRVFVYKVVRPAVNGGNGTKIQVTVSHDGINDEQNYIQNGESEWVEVGTYSFSGAGNEFIQMTKMTPITDKDEKGNTRVMQADAVKLVKAGEYVAQFPIVDGVIDIAQWGAFPDDEVDDSDVIRKAVNKAVSLGNVKVVFHPGNYLLSPPAGAALKGSYYLTLNQAKQVTLEGNQTTFLFTDQFCGGILMRNCEDTTIKGVAFEYQKAPISQGTILSIDRNVGTFIYQVMDGYDTIADQRMAQLFSDSFGVLLQKENPYLLKPSADNFFRITGVTSLGANRFRLQLQNRNFAAQITEGDWMAFNNRGVVGTTFRVEYCTNPSIIDCTVYSTPGTVVTSLYHSGTFLIDGLKAIRKPDSDRWLVSGADGIHAQGGKGPLIVRNCTFEGLMDDCVNLYQFPLRITKVISDKEIEVIHTLKQLPKPGDTLEIVSLENGTNKGKVKVAQVNGSSLVLEKPVSLTPSLQYTLGDLLFVDENRFQGSVFENNQFRDSRRYGILFRTKDMIIRNNIFQNLGGSGTIAYFGPDGEGPGAENILIENNTYQNCGFVYQDYNQAYAAPLRLVGTKVGGTVFSEPINRQITIRGNRIEGTNRYGIAVTAADGAQIEDNTIHTDPIQNLASGQNAGILIESSKNVTISHNKITDKRPGLTGGMIFTENCSAVTAFDNQFDLVSSVRDVSDDTLDSFTMDFTNTTVRYTTLPPAGRYTLNCVLNRLGEQVQEIYFVQYEDKKMTSIERIPFQSQGQQLGINSPVQINGGTTEAALLIWSGEQKPLLEKISYEK